MAGLRTDEDICVANAPRRTCVLTIAPVLPRITVMTEHVSQERRQVSAPDRTVLRPPAIEAPIEFVELPGDIDLVVTDTSGGQADGLAPSHAGVGQRYDHDEVRLGARQRSAPLGHQQSF